MAAWIRHPRVAIYSHDTFGLGHLTRSTRIARAVHRAIPGSSVLILTGSPIAHRFTFPSGVDYVKLPSVVKTGAELYIARELSISARRVRRIRTQMIHDTLALFRPHLLLVDNVPLGMKGELLPALEALVTRRRLGEVHLILRDVLDEPEGVRAAWEREGVYDVLENLYDAIHVFGSPSIFGTVSAYGLPAAKTSYMGYVGPVEDDLRATLPLPPRPPGRSRILVTIGGGGDGADLLVVLGHLQRLLGASSPYAFHVVTGPLMRAQQRRTVAEALEGLPAVSVHDYVECLPNWMGECDLVLSMGGYNTLCEVMARAVRSVVVPRTHPRREQEIRARALERRGVVRVLSSTELTADTLNATLHRVLREGPCISGDRCPPLDGIDRFEDRIRTLLIAGWAGKGPVRLGRRPPMPDGPATGAGVQGEGISAPAESEPPAASAAAKRAGPGFGPLLPLLAAALLSHGIGERTQAEGLQPEQVQAFVGLGYDSNLLNASDAERSAFDTGDPEAFFVVDRMEDLFLDGRLDAKWRLGKPLGLKSKLGLRYERDQFLHNPIKTEQRFQLGLLARLTGRTEISVSASHIPQVYGRHRRDKDAEPGDALFRAETHRRWDLEFQLEQQVASNWKGGLTVGRSWRDYSPPFRERDRRQNEVQVKLGWRGLHAAKLEVGVGYERARSRNEPDLGDDRSYREWSVEPVLTLDRVRPFSGIALGYKLSWRSYTSNLPEDWNHYRRDDRLGTLHIELARAVSSSVDVIVEYSYDWRTAHLDSDRSVDLDEEGSASEQDVVSGIRWTWERQGGIR